MNRIVGGEGGFSVLKLYISDRMSLFVLVHYKVDSLAPLLSQSAMMMLFWFENKNAKS